MKKLMVLIFIILAAVIPSVSAQSGQPIAYGETVSGTTTAPTDEIRYTFTAKDGDAVVILFGDFEYTSDLSDTKVSLRDSGENELLLAEGFSNVTVIFAVPAAGDYSIVATAGTPGDWTLTVLQPPVLTSGSKLDDTVTSEEVDYYLVQTDQPFTLTYTRTGGDYNPEVVVQIMSEFGFGLTPVASLTGTQMTGGVMEVEPGDSTLYLVTVQRALFDFSFDTTTADYTLTFK